MSVMSEEVEGVEQMFEDEGEGQAASMDGAGDPGPPSLKGRDEVVALAITFGETSSLSSRHMSSHIKAFASKAAL